MRIGRLACVLYVLSATGCDSSQPVDRPVTLLSVTSACDVQQGCETGDAGLTVHVQFTAPPRALKPFSVSVRAVGRQSIEMVTVTFSMKGMDMGLNRYRMLGDNTSGWQAKVTLPICVSGRSDWIAEFELVSAGRRTLLPVPFVLEP